MSEFRRGPGRRAYVDVWGPGRGGQSPNVTHCFFPHSEHTLSVKIPFWEPWRGPWRTPCPSGAPGAPLRAPLQAHGVAGRRLDPVAERHHQVSPELFHACVASTFCLLSPRFGSLATTGRLPVDPKLACDAHSPGGASACISMRLRSNRRTDSCRLTHRYTPSRTPSRTSRMSAKERPHRR